MARKYEVFIIGAGPSGLITALVFAQSGINIRIVDKKQ